MFRWRLRRRAPPVLAAREAYERVAAVYPSAAGNPLMALDEAAIAELLPPLAGLRALDAGCGSGRYLRRLAEAGAGVVVGCDLADAMLRRVGSELASWPAAPRPRLARADVLSLPFRDGAFDLVVCALVLGHVADLARALGEITRVLAPGGVALWSDVHPAGTLAGWVRDLRDARGERVVVRQHLHLFVDHVAACRAAGLVIEDAREPRIDCDHPQRGWPAVLTLRARKRG
jgi:malonyl-CoA O-methyltransferase